MNSVRDSIRPKSWCWYQPEATIGDQTGSHVWRQAGEIENHIWGRIGSQVKMRIVDQIYEYGN